MENKFSTLGYGLLFDETIQLLNSALNIQDVKELRKTCIKLWPQKSEANKERIWRHIKFRFLEINNDKVVLSPFLSFFQKINNDNVSVKDLHFFQLCIKTPILYETLSSLISESFINTGEAHFSNYHLNQLLEKKYKRIPSSTKNRLLSIMIKSKRLKVDKSNYSVIAYCPNEAVLGYGLYHDSLKNGWRSPSTATIINDGTIAPIFMCNRSLLIAGVKKLAIKGHCEYHQHGSTDQVQLIHQTLDEYVDAWK